LLYNKEEERCVRLGLGKRELGFILFLVAERMSIELDTTGVTGPNSGPKPQRKWKRLKRRDYEYEPPIRRDYEFEPPIRREPLRKELQSKVSQKVYVCNVFDNSLETYTQLVLSNVSYNL
jgi:hypothetical protein